MPQGLALVCVCPLYFQLHHGSRPPNVALAQLCPVCSDPALSVPLSTGSPWTPRSSWGRWAAWPPWNHAHAACEYRYLWGWMGSGRKCNGEWGPQLCFPGAQTPRHRLPPAWASRVLEAGSSGGVPPSQKSGHQWSRSPPPLAARAHLRGNRLGLCPCCQAPTVTTQIPSGRAASWSLLEPDLPGPCG